MSKTNRVLAAELVEKLPETIFTARFDEATSPGKNLIWCSTFQLAWDALGKDILGGDPKLEGTPPLEVSLNRHLTRSADLDDESYIAMAGFGRDRILERIREGLKKRFAGDAAPSLLPDDVGPEDILAYAYLYKNLEFETPFQDLGAKPFFLPRRAGAAQYVEAFGLEPDQEPSLETPKMRRQVVVLHYRNDEDFAIELRNKSVEDRLLFAKLTPGATLQETVEAATERILGETCSKPALGDDETLQIAKADFDITRQFPEIVGRSFLNRGFERYFVAEAMQNIRFKLNEKGALLKSEAAVLAALGLPEGPEPRFFNLCTPHLVLLMRRGASRPYFAFWVANTELLVLAESGPALNDS